jgi:hypothetical protein
MLRCYLLSLLLLPFLASSPRTVQAGALPEHGIGTAIVPVRGPNDCSIVPGIDYIGDWTYSLPTLSTPEGPFFSILIIACNDPDSLGIGGVEFGVEYDGGYAPGGGATPISVFQWSSCGDLEFPSTGWPAPGTGNLITWTSFNCDDADAVLPDIPHDFMLKVVGHFYMGAYAPASFRIVPRQVSGQMAVAYCSGFTRIIPYPGGVAGFRTPGWPGCLSHPLPVRPTTWSDVKTLYR